MSFPNNNTNDPKVEHSQPIPIATNGHSRRRAGSMFSDSSPSSTSSDSSLNSPNSPLSPVVSIPNNMNGNQNKVPISPSTSPILSYFLSNSPTATFPFRRNINAVVVEDDETDSPTVTRHARSATIAGAWPGPVVAADRFVSPPQPPQQGVQTANQPGTSVADQHGRAAGLLRRLSLGAALKPQFGQYPPHHRGNSPPPNSPENDRRTSPTPMNGVARKTRRANTMAPGTPRPRRAPSPMGERILKGHFDGFN
ncbi:hypothetical protein QCA50_014421 [Cerrena zonata]|uniref:Uncharacterized protein n=1 Tax=Cerrena zonata TaxID=2478898 RepID=A0AAW0FZ56_9APHY